MLAISTGGIVRSRSSTVRMRVDPGCCAHLGRQRAGLGCGVDQQWAPVGTEDPDVAELLTSSYLRLVGEPLIDQDVPAANVARWLYQEAPFGLLAHRQEADPRFFYANEFAQRCFGYSWDEFVGLPSQYSAASPDRAERARLLNDVARNGYSNNYRGLRISKSNAQFWIEDATVWNLVDADGALHGQAAVFRSVIPA